MVKAFRISAQKSSSSAISSGVLAPAAVLAARTRSSALSWNATVDAAAIPNYMEAMTMEYPVKSKSDIDALQVGEEITATVDVKSDDSYALANIKPKKK